MLDTLKQRIFALAFTSASLLITPVLAEESPLWKTVKGWDIRVDTTIGNGCFLTSMFEDNTAFRLGFDRKAGGAYTLFGNPAWRSIEPGKEYSVKVQTNGETPWTANATGMLMTDLPTIHIVTSSLDFLLEVKRKRDITLFVGDKKVTTLNLKGSSDAVDELFVCQQQVDQTAAPEAPSANADPFSDGSVKPAVDPFAM